MSSKTSKEAREKAQELAENVLVDSLGNLRLLGVEHEDITL